MRIFATLLAAAASLLMQVEPVSGHCPALSAFDATVEEARLGAGGLLSLEPVSSAMNLTAVQGFCGREPSSVICTGHKGHALSFAQIVRIDTRFRNQFDYRTDQGQFGVPDFFKSHTTCGDCEDYGLSLSERLAAAGQSGRRMALMFSGTHGGAHATLQVYSADRGWLEISVGNKLYASPQVFDPTGLNGHTADGRPWHVDEKRLCRIVLDGTRTVSELLANACYGPKRF